jgi:hypothetical protein
MNNSQVQQQLDECAVDLVQVATIVTGLGIGSNIVPYLTKYALIRACGVIEQSFKAVIVDHCSRRSKKQVKQFLTRRIRDGSANPSFDNMCRFLGDFDDDWKCKFKEELALEPNKTQLMTSLQSLVDARNNFAHGGNPSASLGDVTRYFADARRIIEIMDQVVS